MKREEFEAKTKTRKEKKKKKQILMTRKRYDDIIVRNQCTVEDEVVGRDDDVVADEEEEEEEEVFDVYIEDTDHYGVVYYANYFKFCAQAFEGYLVNRSSMIKRDEVVCDYIKWAKYLTAAKLGYRISVKTKVLKVCEEKGESIWDVEHRVLKRTKSDVDDDVVCFTCNVQYSNSQQRSDDVDEDEIGNSNNSNSSSTEIRLFKTELSANASYHVDVLRWFERNRTDRIGGPNALERLKSEEECVVVVSAIENVSIDHKALGNIASTTKSTIPILESFSSITFKRRDVQCEFSQTIQDRTGKLIAAGSVTCTIIHRDSMKPRKCPDRLKLKLLA